MKTIQRIMMTELRILFYSPIAWLVLIIFAVQSGIVFTTTLNEWYVTQVSGEEVEKLTSTIFQVVFRTMLDNLYLYIPLLTMGLISREISSGSIKLLYSSPVSNIQIISGKYLSMLVYGMGFVAILLVEIVIGSYVIENFDTGMPLSALLSFYFTFCTYTAIGLFMSTITSYQVVAALGTLAILGVLSFIQYIGQEVDFVRDITFWLSVTGRSQNFIKGVIGSADVLYYLLIVSLFLSLSIWKLNADRSKIPTSIVYIQYAVTLIIVLACGYLTSLPGMKYYYDATQNQKNTLSVESKELLKRLPDNLTLVTYVNILDWMNYIGMPAGRIEDINRFEKYLRYKPDMKMKYVYYYHKSRNPYMWKVDTTLDARTRMEKIAEIDDWDPDMFLPYDQIRNTVDLSEERFGFVRQFEYENGKKAFLRIFNDRLRFPTETEISSTLATLIDKSPVIAFTTGHGERRANDYGWRGYGSFAKEPSSRMSLVNRGYTVVTTSLDDVVADSIDVLVISDLQKALTEPEIAHLETYLEKGGNLLLLGEMRQQAYMNPVAALLGLRFGDDILVQSGDRYPTDVITSRFTEEIAKEIPGLEYPYRQQVPFGLASAIAIEQTGNKGFKVVDVLQTSEKGVWNEKQSVDFKTAHPELNPEAGEKEKAYSVMKYLTRKVGEKEQRIFVLGDADCLTPAVTNSHRTNSALPNVLFEWLTYERFPIKVTLYPARDNKIIMDQAELDWIRLGNIWGIPLLILLSFSIVQFKRRRTS